MLLRFLLLPLQDLYQVSSFLMLIFSIDAFLIFINHRVPTCLWIHLHCRFIQNHSAYFPCQLWKNLEIWLCKVFSTGLFLCLLRSYTATTVLGLNNK
ncbi:hypothetical protein ZIOFF_068183 [Zingiber officinale]|uniref:Uncharacterized protein n=1 Tax=Zingiber officinale TaxID=94328 RepID=A0A8J5EUY1_ZINOF|nr:hypothetical protein ZIOFF_068183 [Zingiber officinale]